MANKPLCNIDECRNASFARGMCRAHYGRWWKFGDARHGGGLQTAKGEVLKFYREVVLAYEGDECLIWPFARKEGYGVVRINREQQLVTRLVCEEEHGPPPTPKHEAAHSCGKGHEGCCTKRHLSWKTSVENKADMVAHGTSLKGERNPSSKLTARQVSEIRGMRGMFSQQAIAEHFGVSRGAVGLILAGKKWGWLE